MDYYPLSVAAVTNVTFTFSGAGGSFADAILVVSRPSASVTFTKVDGTTLAIDLTEFASGTIIPIPCTKIVFADGAFVALKRASLTASLTSK